MNIKNVAVIKETRRENNGFENQCKTLHWESEYKIEDFEKGLINYKYNLFCIL